MQVQEMAIAILNRVVTEGLVDKVPFETYYFNCVLGRGEVIVLKCNYPVPFFRGITA